MHLGSNIRSHLLCPSLQLPSVMFYPLELFLRHRRIVVDKSEGARKELQHLANESLGFRWRTRELEATRDEG